MVAELCPQTVYSGVAWAPTRVICCGAGSLTCPSRDVSNLQSTPISSIRSILVSSGE